MSLATMFGIVQRVLLGGGSWEDHGYISKVKSYSSVAADNHHEAWWEMGRDVWIQGLEDVQKNIARWECRNHEPTERCCCWPALSMSICLSIKYIIDIIVLYVRFLKATNSNDYLTNFNASHDCSNHNIRSHHSNHNPMDWNLCRGRFKCHIPLPEKAAGQHVSLIFVKFMFGWFDKLLLDGSRV